METIRPHKSLSVRRQCSLLQVPRSSLYYLPVQEKPENVKMMRLMDEHLLEHPTEGVLSMVDLLRDKGYAVGPKRIRRLFRLMGYQAIYRKKNLTKGALKAFIRPYLLRGLKIERANQVWCVDITYIPMAKGFMYMVAFIDVYSRKSSTPTRELSLPAQHGSTIWRSKIYAYLWTGKAEPPTTLGLNDSGKVSNKIMCT